MINDDSFFSYFSLVQYFLGMRRRGRRWRWRQERRDASEKEEEGDESSLKRSCGFDLTNVINDQQTLD